MATPRAAARLWSLLGCLATQVSAESVLEGCRALLLQAGPAAPPQRPVPHLVSPDEHGPIWGGRWAVCLLLAF